MSKTTAASQSLDCNHDCLRYHGGPEHSEDCPLYDLPQCPCRAEMIDGPHAQVCYDSGWITLANRAVAQLAMRRQPQEEQQNQQGGDADTYLTPADEELCDECGRDTTDYPVPLVFDAGRLVCIDCAQDRRRQQQEEQQNQQGRRERLWQCEHCGKVGMTTRTDKTQCARECVPNRNHNPSRTKPAAQPQQPSNDGTTRNTSGTTPDVNDTAGHKVVWRRIAAGEYESLDPDSYRRLFTVTQHGGLWVIKDRRRQTVLQVPTLKQAKAWIHQSYRRRKQRETSAENPVATER